MAFSLSRLITIFGGAALLGGLGSTAWATGGMSFFKNFIGVLLITTLIGGALVLVRLMSGRQSLPELTTRAVGGIPGCARTSWSFSAVDHGADHDDRDQHPSDRSRQLGARRLTQR
jgi:hypothetical protein